MGREVLRTYIVREGNGVGSGRHDQQFPELFSDFAPVEDALPKKDGDNGFELRYPPS